jgi:hypothetical protein
VGKGGRGIAGSRDALSAVRAVRHPERLRGTGWLQAGVTGEIVTAWWSKGLI